MLLFPYSVTVKENSVVFQWNFPALIVSNNVGPALAAGNTVVLKPAMQTPLTPLYLVSLMKEAGFPPGVVNIVPGHGHTAGKVLVTHSDVDNVSYTGISEVSYNTSIDGNNF
nr:aldehyde dehydrogenase, cytosolic 1-like [Parasteatoda tepidariorum]